MKIHRTFLIATVLLLTGCPVYQINRAPSSSLLPAPDSTIQSGDYSHTPSGYNFPNEIAGFKRNNISRFDTAGLNIGVGYNGGSTECQVILTIYVYPAPRMSFIGADPAVVRSLEASWLESAYAEAKREIASGHPNALLQKEDSKVQDSVPGKKAVYEIDNNESQLYVFLIDRTWFLKYRVTYLAQCRSEALKPLDAFFANWRGRDS